MRSIQSLLPGVVLLCFVQASLFADGDGLGRYSVIAQRNTFGLAAPPVHQSAVPKSPELPQINLSGFASVGIEARAFLVIHPRDSEAPHGSRNRSPEYLSLAKGEKAGAVELLRIDEAEELVEILYAGIPVTLTMKANGNGSGGDAGSGQAASLTGAQAIGPLRRNAGLIAAPFNQKTPGGDYAGSGPFVAGGARLGSVGAAHLDRPMGGAASDASQSTYEETVANGPPALSNSNGAAASAAPPAERTRAQNPRVYAATKYGYPPDLQ